MHVSFKKIKEPARLKLFCAHEVRVGETDTYNRRMMAERRQRRGIPLDACGITATYMYQEKPLCRAHAGHIALNILLEKS